MNDIRPLESAQCVVSEVLNLGAGTGRWIVQEAKRLGLQHPLGIEQNPGKVARAQEQGLPVYQGDFMQLNPRAFPEVRAVVFDNVLEHLPTLDAVEAAFVQGAAIASHVVYIRHPSFEDEHYLASLGLKQYWTDWPGVHTAHIRLHEFVEMAARNGIYDFSVRGVKRAEKASDPTILPLSAPPGQRKSTRGPGEYGLYDEALHGEKPRVKFDRPVYFAFDSFFFLSPDAPAVQYRVNTNEEVARPYLTWPRPPRKSK